MKKSVLFLSLMLAALGAWAQSSFYNPVNRPYCRLVIPPRAPDLVLTDVITTNRLDVTTYTTTTETVTNAAGVAVSVVSGIVPTVETVATVSTNQVAEYVPRETLPDVKVEARNDGELVWRNTSIESVEDASMSVVQEWPTITLLRPEYGISSGIRECGYSGRAFDYAGWDVDNFLGEHINGALYRSAQGDEFGFVGNDFILRMVSGNYERFDLSYTGRNMSAASPAEWLSAFVYWQTYDPNDRLSVGNSLSQSALVSVDGYEDAAYAWGGSIIYFDAAAADAHRTIYERGESTKLMTTEADYARPVEIWPTITPELRQYLRDNNPDLIFSAELSYDGGATWETFDDLGDIVPQWFSTMPEVD